MSAGQRWEGAGQSNGTHHHGVLGYGGGLAMTRYGCHWGAEEGLIGFKCELDFLDCCAQTVGWGCGGRHGRKQGRLVRRVL